MTQPKPNRLADEDLTSELLDPGWLTADQVAGVIAEVREHRATIERVRALHAPISEQYRACLQDGLPLPCPTTEALNGAS